MTRVEEEGRDGDETETDVGIGWGEKDKVSVTKGLYKEDEG